MSKCRAHVEIMDFPWALLRWSWTGCCRNSKWHLFSDDSLPLKNVKVLLESWRDKNSFLHVKNHAGKATCFSQLCCYGWGRLYPLRRQQNCTETPCCPLMWSWFTWLILHYSKSLLLNHLCARSCSTHPIFLSCCLVRKTWKYWDFNNTKCFSAIYYKINLGKCYLSYKFIAIKMSNNSLIVACFSGNSAVSLYTLRSPLLSRSVIDYVTITHGGQKVFTVFSRFLQYKR